MQEKTAMAIVCTFLVYCNFQVISRVNSQKANEQIIINYKYTSGIITLKLTWTAFAAQFDVCVNDFLVCQ